MPDLYELDELYWFIGKKPHTETHENTYIFTMVSREPRQLVGFDVSMEKSAKYIQAIVDYVHKEHSELLSLQGVDWNRIYEALMSIPNPMACTVIQCIERLLAKDYSTWDRADYETLGIFRDNLKNHVEEGDGRIRGMYMKELVFTINDFLKDRIGEC